MAARLIAEEGPTKGLVLSLEDGEEWVIGRDPEESQLIIEDPAASRKHLLVRSTPEGIEIENLSGTNPVFRNDEEIEAPTFLKHGDAIRIGNGLYRFYQEIEAEVDDMPMDESPVEDSLEEEKRPSIFEESESESESPPLAEVDFDLSDSSPWLLKVVDGPNNGAEFSMQPGSAYTIGSDPNECDIVFHDVSVSRGHAKLLINNEGKLSIEDLGSSNGTIIEGRAIEEKQELEENTIVSLGTSSFIVFNREGERQTVISPLLPSIVKSLQDRQAQAERELAEQARSAPAPRDAELERETEKSGNNVGTLILVTVISGLFILVSMGTAMLFQSEQIAAVDVDTDAEFAKILGPHRAVKYSYNPSTGRLLLVGHVLTAVERNQIRYNLTALPFVSTIDDNIVVDEFIWQEANQVFSKNPAWKGVAIHSPEPGKFVLSGSLSTSRQSEELNDYMNQNFPYLGLLERRVIVEEEVVSQVNNLLRASGLRDIAVRIRGGDVSLSGTIGDDNSELLAVVIDEIRQIDGIRTINNFISEIPTAQAVVNITGSYPVTGSSTAAGRISVIIRGRILSKGDLIDGMTITDIVPGTVMLDKDGIKYRIDYNP